MTFSPRLRVSRMHHFPLKHFLLIFALLLFNLPALAAAEVRGRVSWVYDGDTVKVDGVGKVRLLGVDTPEKTDSSRDDSFHRAGIPRKNLRGGAKRATDFILRTAKGKVVTLKFDESKKDRYGRILAYVILPDGRLLNRELLREGLARVYRRFDFQLKDDFLKAEATAREARRGLWR